ncbi:MAG: MetQ/NlpA family ABC transporter substrate-binding protein, partial [Carnobacterium sp.]
MKKLKKLAIGTILTAGVLLTAACGNGNEATGEETTTVKLGVVGEVNEPWEYVKEQLAADGINLELVKFSDYATPNTAL